MAAKNPFIKSFSFGFIVLISALSVAEQEKTIGADELNPIAFNCSFEIGEGKSSVRSFVLNQKVYECFLYTQYQDMTIVNALSQPVPWHLTTLAESSQPLHFEEDFFLFTEPQLSNLRSREQLELISQLSGLDFFSSEQPQFGDLSSQYSSLLLQRPQDNKYAASNSVLNSITVNLNHNIAPVNATILVQASHDLQNWKTLSPPFHLYYLPGETKTLHNNTITLNQINPFNYLRLAILSDQVDFIENIENVVGDYSYLQITDPAIQWVSAETEYLFDENELRVQLPGLMPISKIRLTPSNSIVFFQGALSALEHTNPEVELDESVIRKQGKEKLKKLIRRSVSGKTETHDSETWRSVTHFTQYRIQRDDQIITSHDISIAPQQSQHWKFKLAQPQALIAREIPEIEFGWKTQQVTFVAQGKGPFRLLVGSTNTPPRLPIPKPLSASSITSEPVVLSSNSNVENSGHKGMQDNPNSQTTSTPSKYTWLLWLILGMGVLVLTTMAFRLYKSMNNDKSSTPK